MVRPHNEDNFLVDVKLKLYIVCDGMGGHLGGEVASAVAVNAVRDALSGRRDILAAFEQHDPRYGEADILAVLEDAVCQANRRIFERSASNPAQRGMGTTLSLLLVIGTTGFYAHVGDTRVYRFRDDRLQQLTEDHSLINEMARSMNVPADSFDKRLKNAITRAVGVHDNVEVDTACFPIQPGDRFLLASDGLHGLLDEVEIAMILGEADLQDVVGQLIQRSNDAGGNDNITAIVVQVGNTGDALPTNATQPGFAVLRGTLLLESLTDDELRRLLALMRAVTVDAGRQALAQGTRLAGLYVIADGEAVIRRDRNAIANLVGGDHFGEGALFADVMARASIAAAPTAELTMFVLDRAAFDTLATRAPALAIKVASALSRFLSRRLSAVASQVRDIRPLFKEPSTITGKQARAGSPDARRETMRPIGRPKPRLHNDPRAHATTLPAPASAAVGDRVEGALPPALPRAEVGAVSAPPPLPELPPAVPPLVADSEAQ